MWGGASIDEARESLTPEPGEPLEDGANGDAGGLCGLCGGPPELKNALDDERTAVWRGLGVRMELHSWVLLRRLESWYSTDCLRGPRMNNVPRNHI